MATQINQTRDSDRGMTVLHVEGDMYADDALLIEKFSHEARELTGDNVMLDLADLDFMDSDAASVLRRITEQEWFRIEGMEIFLQSVVDHAERRGT